MKTLPTSPTLDVPNGLQFLSKHLKLGRLSLAVVVLGAAPAVNAELIWNDQFTDGSVTAANATELNWFSVNSQSLTFQTDDGSPGIGSGNALRSNATPSFGGVVGVGQQVTLNDGDSLTLSVAWRFLGSSPNVAEVFRIGLYDSKGTFTTANNQLSVRRNDAGYFGRTNPGSASVTGTALSREAGGNGELGFGTDVTTSTSTGTSVSAGLAPQTAVLTILRTGGSLSLSYSISGQTAATFVDGAPVTFSFDQFYMGMGNATGYNILLDNVLLDYTAAIPEPSHTSLLSGCAVALFLFRRRRTQQV